MKTWRKAPRALRWTLIAFVVVIFLSLISAILVARDDQNASEKPKASTVATGGGGETGNTPSPGRFEVQASDVPQSVGDAQDAAPIQLTPGRWESDPANAQGDVPTQLTEAQRRQVTKSAGEFLELWETYPSFKVGEDWIDYQNKLRPHVAAGDFSDVVTRVDSHAPAFQCAQPICDGGSQPVVYKGYATPAQNAEIRAYDPKAQTVYLITYATVRYTGKTPLAGKTFNRSYGLLLENQNGTWVVSRAAADTTSPAS